MPQWLCLARASLPPRPEIPRRHRDTLRPVGSLDLASAMEYLGDMARVNIFMYTTPTDGGRAEKSGLHYPVRDTRRSNRLRKSSTWRSVSSNVPSVRTTKSASRSFSVIGHWASIRRRACSSLSPSRA